MPSRILILVIISVLSPAKSLIVEFKPSDLASDLVLLWKYYEEGGDTNVRAYIDIPNATFAVIPTQIVEGLVLVLSLGVTFREDKPVPRSCKFFCREENIVKYIITARRNGTFYAYPQTEDTYSTGFIEIEADTPLKYHYHQEIAKEAPYIVIRYASIEEIQREIDYIFQGVDFTKNYYPQPTYAISYGPDGHFLKFVERRSSHLTIVGDDKVIRMLFGSIRKRGQVVTITSRTTKPYLIHDIDSESPLEVIEGALGIRMATIGVLAERNSQNEVSLFTLDNLDHHTRFVDISYKDIKLSTSDWSDCFLDDPPLRLLKGFEVVINGHLFVKRCGFPIDSDNEEVKRDGRKIIIDIVIANSNTKFTRFYIDFSRSSSQIYMGKNENLYMIVENTQLLIDKFVKIRYYF